MLGLPLLTYDMSDSGHEGSYLGTEGLPLVNGDLLQWLSQFINYCMAIQTFVAIYSLLVGFC